VQLREWLTEDGASFDDAHLSAALTRLAATLPGSNTRLIRGSELHRRNSSRYLPATHLPQRAMMLESLRSRDATVYAKPISSPTWSETPAPAWSCQGWDRPPAKRVPGGWWKALRGSRALATLLIEIRWPVLNLALTKGMRPISQQFHPRSDWAICSR
jgi:hypothetical protein